MAMRSKKEIEAILEEYKNGMSKAEINKKYGMSYETINKWIKKCNIPDNGTGRFSQIYESEENGEYTKIRIKKGTSYVEALIDNEDVDKCKSIGIWSLTKAGYIINCQTGIYLHRLVMNAATDEEVDHIYHDLLDNRKSKLRIANSRQQKFNTKLRVDNTSGHRGIYWDKPRKKWHVNIKNGEERANKRFDTYEEAVAFCEQKFKEWHQEFLYKTECAA